MVKFNCVQKINETQTSWVGKIRTFKDNNSNYEINVDGINTGMRIIFGNSERGSFISLPEYGVSCGADSFSNASQNYEKLAPLIGEVDAITVAEALNKMSEVLF